MFNLGRKKDAGAEIMPQELQKRLQQDESPLVLDVREPHEYRQGHLKGSVHIPLDQLAFRSDELPRDRAIVAMCRSGNRSGVATEMLKRAGFDAVNLQGGILLWERLGLPVERP